MNKNITTCDFERSYKTQKMSNHVSLNITSKRPSPGRAEGFRNTLGPVLYILATSLEGIAAWATLMDFDLCDVLFLVYANKTKVSF